jgi:ring-1,2-phenylacetyl-CoA epoxidase subunit PaaC
MNVNNSLIDPSANKDLGTATDNLINYTIHLADNALILGHRNSEWTGHGPILEQDIALSNIALDLIGQSRNLYQYAAQLINEHQNKEVFKNKFDRDITEDDLAYLRDALDFKNCILVEQPNGDWAKTILRQFFFSTFQYYFYQQLLQSNDTQLAAIAEKSLKETTYHLRWSSEWIIRLGDGTEESHERMLKAQDELWMYTQELFEPVLYETEAFQQGFGVDIESIKPMWTERVTNVFEEATLPVPQAQSKVVGGKNGIHSEHLGFILAEMQFLQRAYPNSKW